MKKCVLPLLCILCLCACNDTIKVIKGCCNTPAVVSRGDVGWVYIPNVFTPNGDGLHDHLIINGDSMKQVVHMKIWHENGAIVFNKDNFPVNDETECWDGTFNGKVQRGMYSYEMWVETITGYKWEIKGTVCNCPCDQPADEDIAPIRNCEFGLCDPNFTDCNQDEYLSCFEN